MSASKKKIIKEYPVGTTYGEEEIAAIRRLLESGETLTRGADVELFEEEFAAYCGAKHAVALSSCGAALRIAVQLLHLGLGDEVICQANVFWATFAPLLERQVVIRCAEINPQTLNIDPQKIQSLITAKTKAIFLMHHGGNPADLEPIYQIARAHDLVVVEDAAHAVGAEYRGKKIGASSDIACYSFSSLKNISTLGEGGMLLTNNKKYAEMAKGLRTSYPFGRKTKRETTSLGEYPKPDSPAFMHGGDAWDYDWTTVEEIGTNYRMSSPQAAVGRIQLKKLDNLIARRAEIAHKFNDLIDNIEGLSKVSILPSCKHAWHLFTFFLEPQTGINRNEFVKHMEENYNIHIVIRYWPIHLGAIMRLNGHRPGECPACEDVWFNRQLSLPISPQMTEAEVNYICQAVRETFKTLRK